jgi:prepilin-type N-terminal cleavage/methylation domain-containing protein
MKTWNRRQKAEDRRQKVLPDVALIHSATGTGDRAPDKVRPLVALRAFPRAFTLIEILIVIGIIAVLAAMVFPITGAVKRTQIRTRARGELVQLETAIEAYKSRLGYYPPDSAPNYVVNQLYFELLGTTNVGTAAAPVYRTLDGTAQIAASSFASVFGPNVSGFLNCTRGGGDEGLLAEAFLRGLKPAQAGELSQPPPAAGAPPVRLLVGIPWPADNPNPPLAVPPAKTPGMNPWRYNSSNPTNNPKSFDLWIDVIVGSQTNRICNWSEQPLVVGAP